MTEECQMLINDLREMAETFHEGSGYDVLLRVGADAIERLTMKLAAADGANQQHEAEIERLRLDLQIEKAFHTNTPYYYELCRKREAAKAGGEE